MRAVQLVEIGSPLQARDVPMSSMGENDVLVRIKAAGICHSDVHYQLGVAPVGPLPQTLGHEIAGIVEAIGSNVTSHTVGQRVCLHYLLTCGDCAHCLSASEQFCRDAKMIGKDCDGGYAEYIAVPARNAVPLPDEVPFEQGAVLMCSSATVFHALCKARLRAGETVAVFGVGGLGMSAIQLAKMFGALDVYAVDIHEQRLAMAESYGAVPIDASAGDPVRELLRESGAQGVDVALGLVGMPEVMRQAVQALAPRGRAVIVGITDRLLAIDPYREIVGREGEIIGSSDHLLQELPVLVEFVRQGRLDLSHIVTQAIPLAADAVNRTLERLKEFGPGVRCVIEA